MKDVTHWIWKLMIVIGSILAVIVVGILFFWFFFQKGKKKYNATSGSGSIVKATMENAKSSIMELKVQTVKIQTVKEFEKKQIEEIQKTKDKKERLNKYSEFLNNRI